GQLPAPADATVHAPHHRPSPRGTWIHSGRDSLRGISDGAALRQESPAHRHEHAAELPKTITTRPGRRAVGIMMARRAFRGGRVGCEGTDSRHSCPAMPRKLRLAGVVSHPIQYHAPLFRCLTSHPDIDFTAIFLSDHGIRPTFDPGFGRVLAYDVPLLEGYRHLVLRNCARRPHTQRFLGAVNPGLAAVIIR